MPPCGRGFSRHQGLSIRWGFGTGTEGDFRARDHRLDEPAELSLGKVASQQSPLPFHPATPLQLQKSNRLARAQLTLLARLLQLAVAGGVDLVLAARQHVRRRHEPDGAVQAHRVVVLDVALD